MHCLDGEKLLQEGLVPAPPPCKWSWETHSELLSPSMSSLAIRSS